MRKNIARIKINNVGLISLYYLPNNRSYLLAIPKMTVRNGCLESHYSFHTKNNRITAKITRAGNSLEDFNLFREEAKKKGLSVTEKDIDLLRGKYLGKNELANKLAHWQYFSYNFLHDDFLKKTIAKTKTNDSEFNKIINLYTTKNLPAIYIAVYISKNLKVDSKTLVSAVAKHPIHRKYFIKDQEEGDVYTFSILVKLTEKFITRKMN